MRPPALERCAKNVESAPVYRPDIDGLRAIAVVSVALFHAGVPGFSGGYIGVDVFFVISGYLITQLLDGSRAKPLRPWLTEFYIRRARRILPALFAMTLVAARDLAPFGVRVVTIAPGLFSTPMFNGMHDAARAMIGDVPFPRRAGEPAEFAKPPDIALHPRPPPVLSSIRATPPPSADSAAIRRGPTPRPPAIPVMPSPYRRCASPAQAARAGPGVKAGPRGGAALRRRGAVAAACSGHGR